MGWSRADIPDQTGRRALVTGATGGLGFEVAAALLAAGAEVVLASRDPAKGEAALARLETGRGRARFEPLDLGDLASVRALAARIAGEDRPLDLLVANAGVMAPSRRETTVDGFERQFGVNYLGHFAMAGLLLPALRRAPAARVVTVASLAHRGGRIDFDDLQSRRYSPFAAYGRSKAAMLMFARAFDRRSVEAGWGVRALAAHPGWSNTDLIRPDGAVSRLFAAGAKLAAPLLAQSAAEGALPILQAATDPAAAPGGYLGPTGPGELKGPPGPAKSAAFVDDRAAQDRLWRESEALTGVRYG